MKKIEIKNQNVSLSEILLILTLLFSKVLFHFLVVFHTVKHHTMRS